MPQDGACDRFDAINTAADPTASGTICARCSRPRWMHDAAVDEPLLRFFRYAHLPDPLKATSRDFALIAAKLVADLPRNDERAAMLRKLLEAKDCAVRALLP